MFQFELAKAILVTALSVISGIALKRYFGEHDASGALSMIFWSVSSLIGLLATLFVVGIVQTRLADRRRELHRSPVSQWEVVKTEDGYYRHVDHTNGLLTVGFDSENRLLDFGYKARLAEDTLKDMATRYAVMFPAK